MRVVSLLALEIHGAVQWPIGCWDLLFWAWVTRHAVFAFFYWGACAGTALAFCAVFVFHQLRKHGPWT